MGTNYRSIIANKNMPAH